MFIFYLISFHYIRSDYVSINLIWFDLLDFWLGMKYNDMPEMHKIIEKVFTNWIRSLKSHHKKKGLPQAERAIGR